MENGHWWEQPDIVQEMTDDEDEIDRLGKKAVTASTGIAILSEDAIMNEVAADQLRAVPLDDGGSSRTFYMAIHKDKYQTKATSALIELLVALPFCHPDG